MGPPMNHPSLSVCMIVKDEAHQLAGALENFSSFADEIIVVDTGSSDNTKEIASRYTDRVFDFPWCDDFSAARNCSLDKATGDYVLWMDADDRVEPEMAERIVGLKAAFDGRNAFYFILEDLGADGPTCSFFQLRCVPRRNNVRFFGRIHEQLSLDGLLPHTVDVVIRHHGYLHRDIHRGKIERNLALLKKERDDGRDDAFIHYYLALSSESLGRLDEAIDHMERALRRMQTQTWNSPGPHARQMNLSTTMNIHFHLARFHSRADHGREALRHLTKAQALVGEDARSLFDLGLVFQECREPRKAIRCFERALGSKTVRSVLPAAPMPSREKVLAHIAFGHLRLKEYDVAMARLEEAQTLASKPSEVWELLGFIGLNAGEWSIALQAYESALRAGEISAMGCYFLGCLYKQRGFLGKAVATFKLGLEKDPTHSKTRTALGDTLRQMGDHSQAGRFQDERSAMDGIEEEIFADRRTVFSTSRNGTRGRDRLGDAGGMKPELGEDRARPWHGTCL